MASPRSLIRKVAAEAPLGGSRRSKSLAAESGDASAEPEQPAVPRKGTPRSLIRELAAGRAEVPVPIAAPREAAAQDPRELLKETTAATPFSKKRVSMVQMTLAPPEPARGAPTGTPTKRKESVASNASMATPDASTPASKRSRNSSSPSSGGRDSLSPPVQLSQRHSLSVMSQTSSPPPLPPLSAPAQRGASIAVPRLSVDAPLPFELPDTITRKRKSTPRSKAQVGGAADRKRASVSLPSTLVRRLASSYTKLKIEKDALAAIEDGSDEFLKQLCGDLSAYAKHRKTKTVEKADFECLLKRQRHSYASASLDDLLRRYISAELVEEVLTVAKAGNVLVPGSK